MTFNPCVISKEPIIPRETCGVIIESFAPKTKVVGIGDKNKIVKKTRSTKTHPIQIEEAEDLYALVAGHCNMVNNDIWHFDLVDMEHLQFLEYNPGDHYNYHLDVGPGKHSTRKLSLVIPLSPIEAYEGGELLVKIGEKETPVPLKQGHAILFPSYILHKVTPVTKGKRFMLVGWMKGKTAFR